MKPNYIRSCSKRNMSFSCYLSFFLIILYCRKFNSGRKSTFFSSNQLVWFCLQDQKRYALNFLVYFHESKVKSYDSESEIMLFLFRSKISRNYAFSCSLMTSNFMFACNLSTLHNIVYLFS